ncbi:MAG: repressor LexA [Candidatus Nealsonbacteria bacterium]|nr:repressor LexA [Candidatus Nealsonbacteria bacterium]
MQKETVTKRQKQVLKIIYNSLVNAGFPPSFSELKKKLKISSNQSLLDIFSILERKNLIKREEGSARGIKILKAGYEAISAPPLAPMVGITSAGSFTEAIEEIDAWQPLSKDVETIAEDVMIVRVIGDSMINADIKDGDFILFKKTNDFSSGDIVLAQTPDGTTVKRFISQDKPPYAFLKPENQKYSNIPFTEDMRLIAKMVRKNNMAQEASKKDTKALEPYYDKPKFKLYQADCLDILVNIPENSVDMVFADPPYLLSNGGFSVHAGRRVSVNKGEWDKSNGLKKDFIFHLDWIRAAKRVLKPGGTIWISGTYHSIYQCGFALQAAGFHILNDISWFKPNASPNLSCRFFTASHETLIWARKDKKAKHTFNYDLMKNGNWPEDFIKKPNLQMRSVWAMGSENPEMGAIWTMGTPKTIEKRFGKHPTQKPEDLLKRIVLASTNKGDLVVDPFTGSSTTGIAAYLLGRNFIGIDTDKNYLDLSIKRFEELYKNIKSKLL